MKSLSAAFVFRSGLIVLVLAVGLSACSRLPIGTPSPVAPIETAADQPAPVETLPPPPPVELAEVTFRVTIPSDTPSDGPIQITLLDEVTGLALNTVHQEMQAESENIYGATLLLPANAIVKYRYTRGGPVLAAEHAGDGRPVRYRLLHTTASGSVHDIVSRWNDTQYSGPTGRIDGTITDAASGQPLPGILVHAGGQQTLTRWDGSYLLEGLPPGTHNLVAYAMDGRYSTFQQGAVVATEASTPASFSLQEAALRTVTFVLSVPEDTIPAVPIRIAGNLHQLGNTFADLSAGISTPASRLPVMQYSPEGFYLFSMQLPAGAYVQYKYTLGDGFWNMETDENGRIRLREFIVPDTDTVINDSVTSWNSVTGFAPVWFAVETPPNTPDGDTVWLQLNPWGWTEPLPMWQTGPNSWVYLLTSPLQMVGDVEFRYCRNAACERAREAAPDAPRVFRPSDAFQPFEEPLDRWITFAAYRGIDPVPQVEITPQGAGFVSGLALSSDSLSFSANYAARNIGRIGVDGANTLVISPTWTYTRSAPPVFEPVPGADLSWLDALAVAGAVREAGYALSLFPQPNFPAGLEAWWLEAPKDYAWWVNWFEKYGYFLEHHASLASTTGAETLVVGGNWLNPALPEGAMPDGFTSGVPGDAGDWWLDLVARVRENYAGKLAWALPFPSGVANPPDFLGEFDEIYLLWEAPIAESNESTLEEMAAAAAEAIDETLLPLFLQVNRPIIIVLSFPSFDGGSAACLSLEDAACQPSGPLDMEEQMLAYEAVLQAVNARDWIRGVISGGYFAPAQVRDRGPSVHGKPAEALLSTWFTAWSIAP